ncbi:MAG: hypothetical protein L3J56_00515 [Bacteroidales bacterium]|nr:hypothetical protein [Bacteroidales bacterium]
MGITPIVIGLVAGGVSYLFTKGVSVSKAAEDIDYEISVKNLRIHKVSLLPFAIDTRFSLDIKLVNPTNESFKITHPDIVISYNGKEIGRSVIKNKTYELKKRSEATIQDIQFSIDLSYLSNELSDLISEIKSNWQIGKGLVQNLSFANQSLTKYQDTILKHLSAKINLSINRIPISYEDSLAGGQALGKFILGYAPVSAIDRTIKSAPQFDKYFPLPKGNKERIKRNASTEETVKLMVDIVNKDHKLIKEAALKIFKKPTVEQTARHIFDWIYKHIKYDLEIGEQLRNPLTTYHLGQRLARQHYKEKGFYSKDLSADCDDISIFIASILKNLNIPYLFRIADYSGGGYSHVYTLIPRKGKPPIIIDPVYHAFNAEKTYVREKTFDMNKNALSGIDVYYLSGINNTFGSLTDDTYNYLIKSRAAIAENPQNYKHVADPQLLVQMYDYAIQYWNTPQREQAIDILTQQENSLINAGLIRETGITGLGKAPFFNRLKNLKNKLKKFVGKSDETERAEHEADNSNYANINTPANISSGGDKANNFTETTKAFISKHKWPIVIGTTVLTVGTAYAIKNRKKKKTNG